MKLYETPKAIVDLQKGDIVYTIVNGQIMQARVADFKVAYDIHSEGIKIIDSQHYKGGEKKDTYYDFDLPTGGMIHKTPKYGERTPDIYLSVEDARNDKALEWQYGYCDTYGRGNKDNQDALERFKQYMKKNYGSFFKSGGYLLFFYNNKRTQQVTEVAFNCIYDDNTGDIKISHCDCEYGYLGARINDNIYFATRAECEQAYKPKVLMFDEPEKKPEITHYAVYKRTYNEYNIQSDDELIDMFKTFYDAVAHAALYAYDDGDTLYVGGNVYRYQYIVFPVYGDDDVDLNDIVYHGELYNA